MLLLNVIIVNVTIKYFINHELTENKKFNLESRHHGAASTKNKINKFPSFPFFFA